MAYTSHGHHIKGTGGISQPPENRVRCGGPPLCRDCSFESEQWHKNNELLEVAKEQEPPEPPDYGSFMNELKQLINKHNMEEPSGTPDFVIAAHLVDCLHAYNTAVKKRGKWRGQEVELNLSVEPEPVYQPTCYICGRKRRPDEPSYNAALFMMTRQVGWSSNKDGEICSEDMAQVLNNQ